MKVTRNLAIAVATLAMVAALSFVSAPAFADTVEGSDAPDAPAADASEGDSPDTTPAPGAGGSESGTPETGTTVSGSSTIDSAATPAEGYSAPSAEYDALAGGAGEGEGNGNGFDNGGSNPISGNGVNEGKGSNSDSHTESKPDNDGKSGDDKLGGDTGKKTGEEQPIVEAKGKLGASGNNSDTEANQGTGVAGEEEGDGVNEDEENANNPDDDSQGEGSLESEESLMKAAGGSDAPITLLAANDDDSEATQTDALNSEGELNIALTLVEGALSGSASGALSWTSGKILTEIFGSNLAGDADQKLDSILQSLAEIQSEIKELQQTVDAQELDALLTSMKPLIESNKLHIALSDLTSLNEAKYSQDEYKERLKSVLTEGISNGSLTDFGSLAGTDNTFDSFCWELWRAMTTTYPVDLDGKSQDLTLMQVYYEHLRLKYKWEHQAYAEWEEFNTRCVGLLASSLSLERTSLKMRLELLREYNDTHTDKHDEGAVIAYLNQIQDQINQVKGYKGEVKEESRDPKNPTVKSVNYPGLYNEKAWNEQYWMYKSRPDYRYYWVRGHECLFYAQVNTQDIPPEDTSGNLRNPVALRGIGVTPKDNGRYDAEIIYEHWKPFLNYQGGDSPLASETQLKTMYADYGSSTHLYDIFINPENGNFLGLDEGDIEHWWFVVGQTDDHHITLKNEDGVLFKLYTYVVSSPHATQDTIVLAKYDEYRSDWNSNRHYIGIGVVRYGPEVYNPSKNINDDDENLAKAEVHTEVQYSSSIWWPSHGDLALGYGSKAHGRVERVFMDGRELDSSCYEITNDQIVLTQAYLASLGYGEHKLFLDTKKGDHTFVFSTRTDDVYYVKSGDGSTWAPGMSDGLTFVFKRTDNDETTFSHLVDVLVDGVSVPSWGYIASAGSAIITLTDAFLNTLATGLHTLTAVFDDGNNPSATFTVSGNKTLPAPVANAAAPVANTASSVSQDQTPRTGDSAAVLVVLLATVISASSCIAYRARKRIQTR